MSDFNHAINLTHDGTLILRIPKGYEVDKVVVEEMGTENRKKFVHMPADISDYCEELWEKAYERGKAEIIRCKDCEWWDSESKEKYRVCHKHNTGWKEDDYCSFADMRGDSE